MNGCWDMDLASPTDLAWVELDDTITYRLYLYLSNKREPGVKISKRTP